MASECMLCRAERITPWFHEDDICWIAECEICETPMVVWRRHGVDPPDEHLSHMLAHLKDVAQRQLGDHWLELKQSLKGLDYLVAAAIVAAVGIFVWRHVRR